MKKQYWMVLGFIAIIIIIVDIILFAKFVSKKQTGGVSKTQEQTTNVPSVTQDANSSTSRNMETQFAIKKSGGCHNVSIVLTKVKIGSFTLDIVGNVNDIKVVPKDKNIGYKIAGNKIMFLPKNDPLSSAVEVGQICFTTQSPVSFKITAYEYGTGRSLNVDLQK